MTAGPDHPIRPAVAALRRGDYVAATALCERVLGENRKDTAALDVLAQIAWETGHADRSIELLTRAVKIDSRNARLRTNLGRAYARIGQHARAIGQYDHALKLHPNEPVTLAEKATAYELQGKHDRARRLLRPHVAGGAPTIVAVYLRLLIHGGDLDAAIALGAAVAAADHEPTFALRNTLFELARAYERAGRCDEAFATARRANAMFAVPYDPEADARRVDEIAAFFTAERLASLPRPAAPSPAPVFVFGMPRSGTTLVERILAAHGSVFGGGERGLVNAAAATLADRIGATKPYPACLADLDADDVEREASAFLEPLAALCPRAERIVDKSLENVWHVGLITVLFPRAALVHCRRDPIDTCLSCYMERLMPTSQPFASDLAHLAARHRQHERLMDHWRAVVPMLEIDYEALAADPEPVSRRLVEHVGLPWEDACLRPHESRLQQRTVSHEQVRRPIYTTSIGRAERFGALLDPLREALGRP